MSTVRINMLNSFSLYLICTVVDKTMEHCTGGENTLINYKITINSSKVRDMKC